MKIRPVGVELFHAGGRTDRRTDMTKLIVAFRNLANAPWIWRDDLSSVDAWMYGHNSSTFPSGLISSADETGGIDTNYWSLAVQKGARPGLRCTCFMYFSVSQYIFICELYRLNHWDQTQVRTQIRVFPIKCTYFYSPRPCWEARKHFFVGSRTRSRRPCGLQNSLDIFVAWM